MVTSNINYIYKNKFKRQLNRIPSPFMLMISAVAMEACSSSGSTTLNNLSPVIDSVGDVEQYQSIEIDGETYFQYQYDETDVLGGDIEIFNVEASDVNNDVITFSIDQTDTTDDENEVDVFQIDEDSGIITLKGGVDKAFDYENPEAASVNAGVFNAYTTTEQRDKANTYKITIRATTAAADGLFSEQVVYVKILDTKDPASVNPVNPENSDVLIQNFISPGSTEPLTISADDFLSAFIDEDTLFENQIQVLYFDFSSNSIPSGVTLSYVLDGTTTIIDSGNSEIRPNEAGQWGNIEVSINNDVPASLITLHYRGGEIIDGQEQKIPVSDALALSLGFGVNNLPTIDLVEVGDEVLSDGSNAIRVAENTADAVVLFTITATDDDVAQVLSYRLEGVDAGFFDIEKQLDGTAFITFRSQKADNILAFSPDYEEINPDNNYSITVIIEDGLSDELKGTVSRDLTITVTDVDEAPYFTSEPQTIEVVENIAVGQDILYVSSALDPEGATITYSFEDDGSNDDDEDFFAIDSATGVISFKTSPDYEDIIAFGNNEYKVTVVASDAGGEDASEELVITVRDLDEKPIFVSGSDVSFIFGVDDSSLSIYQAEAMDEDAGSIISYSIAQNTQDGDLFILDANAQLRFKQEPSKGTYSLRITATSTVDGVASDAVQYQDITVTVNVLSFETGLIFEPVSTGVVSAIIDMQYFIDSFASTSLASGVSKIVFDNIPSDFALSYKLPGGDFLAVSSNGEVSIVAGGEVRIEISDASDAREIVLEYKGIDDVGGVEREVEVELVFAIDNLPSVNAVAGDDSFIIDDMDATTISVAENTADNVVLFSVTATDDDVGQVFSYRLEGDDAEFFDVVVQPDGKGFITFRSIIDENSEKPFVPDFETAFDNNGDNIYEINVIAIDNLGGESEAQSLSIAIDDVNEAPSLVDETASALVVNIGTLEGSVASIALNELLKIFADEDGFDDASISNVINKIKFVEIPDGITLSYDGMTISGGETDFITIKDPLKDVILIFNDGSALVGVREITYMVADSLEAESSSSASLDINVDPQNNVDFAPVIAGKPATEYSVFSLFVLGEDDGATNLYDVATDDDNNDAISYTSDNVNFEIDTDGRLSFIDVNLPLSPVSYTVIVTATSTGLSGVPQSDTIKINIEVVDEVSVVYRESLVPKIPGSQNSGGGNIALSEFLFQTDEDKTVSHITFTNIPSDFALFYADVNQQRVVIDLNQAFEVSDTEDVLANIEIDYQGTNTVAKAFLRYFVTYTDNSSYAGVMEVNIDNQPEISRITVSSDLANGDGVADARDFVETAPQQDRAISSYSAIDADIGDTIRYKLYYENTDGEYIVIGSSDPIFGFSDEDNPSILLKSGAVFDLTDVNLHNDGAVKYYNLALVAFDDVTKDYNLEEVSSSSIAFVRVEVETLDPVFELVSEVSVLENIAEGEVFLDLSAIATGIGQSGELVSFEIDVASRAFFQIIDDAGNVGLAFNTGYSPDFELPFQGADAPIDNRYDLTITASYTTTGNEPLVNSREITVIVEDVNEAPEFVINPDEITDTIDSLGIKVGIDTIINAFVDDDADSSVKKIIFVSNPDNLDIFPIPAGISIEYNGKVINSRTAADDRFFDIVDDMDMITISSEASVEIQPLSLFYQLVDDDGLTSQDSAELVLKSVDAVPVINADDPIDVVIGERIASDDAYFISGGVGDADDPIVDGTTIIFTVQATDADKGAGDTIVYSIVHQTSSWDSDDDGENDIVDIFTIDAGGNIRFKAGFDFNYEAPAGLIDVIDAGNIGSANSYIVSVQASLGDSVSQTVDYTVTLTDIDEMPRIVNRPAAIDEDIVVTFRLGRDQQNKILFELNVFDEDVGDINSYSISGRGADFFEIKDSGELSFAFGITPVLGSYSIVLEVKEDADSSSIYDNVGVLVNVAPNAIESGILLDPLSAEKISEDIEIDILLQGYIGEAEYIVFSDENLPTYFSLYYISVSDNSEIPVEPNVRILFSDIARFGIKVIADTSLNAEELTLAYEIIGIGGIHVPLNLAFRVNNSPQFQSISDVNVAEGGELPVIELIVNDPDYTQKITYSLRQTGDEAGDEQFFSIDSTFGVISFSWQQDTEKAFVPDYENPADVSNSDGATAGDGIYQFTVVATDSYAGEAEIVIRVVVTDENDVPELQNLEEDSYEFGQIKLSFATSGKIKDVSSDDLISLFVDPDVAGNIEKIEFIDIPSGISLSYESGSSIDESSDDKIITLTSGGLLSVENTGIDTQGSYTISYQVIDNDGGVSSEIAYLNFDIVASFNPSIIPPSAMVVIGEKTDDSEAVFISGGVGNPGDPITDGTNIFVIDFVDDDGGTSPSISYAIIAQTSGFDYDGDGIGDAVNLFEIATNPLSRGVLTLKADEFLNYEIPAGVAGLEGVDLDLANTYTVTVVMTFGNEVSSPVDFVIKVDNVNDPAFMSEETVDSAISIIIPAAGEIKRTMIQLDDFIKIVIDEDKNSPKQFIATKLNFDLTINPLPIGVSLAYLPSIGATEVDITDKTDIDISAGGYIVVVVDGDNASLTDDQTVLLDYSVIGMEDNVDITPASASASLSFDFTATNDEPVILQPVQDEILSILENTVDVYNVAAYDRQSGILIYSLAGADATLFSIDSEGKIVFNDAPNYGANVDDDNNYEIEIIVEDTDGASDSIVATIVVENDETETPVFLSDSKTAVYLDEFIDSTYIFYTALAEDATSYSLGSGSGDYLIDEQSGSLTFATSIPQSGVYSIIVTASNLNALPGSQTVDLDLMLTIADDHYDVESFDTIDSVLSISLEYFARLASLQDNKNIDDIIKFELSQAPVPLFSIDSISNDPDTTLSGSVVTYSDASDREASKINIGFNPGQRVEPEENVNLFYSLEYKDGSTSDFILTFDINNIPEMTVLEVSTSEISADIDTSSNLIPSLGAFVTVTSGDFGRAANNAGDDAIISYISEDQDIEHEVSYTLYYITGDYNGNEIYQNLVEIDIDDSFFGLSDPLDASKDGVVILKNSASIYKQVASPYLIAGFENEPYFDLLLRSFDPLSGDYDNNPSSDVQIRVYVENYIQFDPDIDYSSFIAVEGEGVSFDLNARNTILTSDAIYNDIDILYNFVGGDDTDRQYFNIDSDTGIISFIEVPDFDAPLRGLVSGQTIVYSLDVVAHSDVRDFEEYYARKTVQITITDDGDFEIRSLTSDLVEIFSSYEGQEGSGSTPESYYFIENGKEVYRAFIAGSLTPEIKISSVVEIGADAGETVIQEGDYPFILNLDDPLNPIIEIADKGDFFVRGSGQAGDGLRIDSKKEYRITLEVEGTASQVSQTKDINVILQPFIAVLEPDQPDNYLPLIRENDKDIIQVVENEVGSIFAFTTALLEYPQNPGFVTTSNYELKGNDKDLFDFSDGVLSFVTPPDYEQISSGEMYEITVELVVTLDPSDSSNEQNNVEVITSRDFQVKVLNQLPLFFAEIFEVEKISQGEGEIFSYDIETLIAPEVSDTLDAILIGRDADVFEIVEGKLQLVSGDDSFDYENPFARQAGESLTDANKYQFSILYTFNQGTSQETQYEKPFEIIIDDSIAPREEAPEVRFSGQAIFYNNDVTQDEVDITDEDTTNDVETILYKVNGFDPEILETLSYQLGNDFQSANFNINSATGEVTAKSRPSAGDKFSVNVMKQNGTTLNVEVSVQVINEDRPTTSIPFFEETSDNIEIFLPENYGETILYKASAVSPGGNNILYSLADTADSAFFTIDSATGVLSNKDIFVPDYENPQDQGQNNQYEITIIATENSQEPDFRAGVAFLSATVTVVDADEQDYFLDETPLSAVFVLGRDDYSEFFADIRVNPDAFDAGTSFSFSLAQNADQDLFLIDELGRLSLRYEPDCDGYCTKTAEIIVEASSSGQILLSDSLTFDLLVKGSSDYYGMSYEDGYDSFPEVNGGSIWFDGG